MSSSCARDVCFVQAHRMKRNPGLMHKGDGRSQAGQCSSPSSSLGDCSRLTPGTELRFQYGAEAHPRCGSSVSERVCGRRTVLVYQGRCLLCRLPSVWDPLQPPGAEDGRALGRGLGHHACLGGQPPSEAAGALHAQEPSRCPPQRAITTRQSHGCAIRCSSRAGFAQTDSIVSHPICVSGLQLTLVLGCSSISAVRKNQNMNEIAHGCTEWNSIERRWGVWFSWECGKGKYSNMFVSCVHGYANHTDSA